MKNKICLALDVDTEHKALELVRAVGPYVGTFKIGTQLFVSEGPSIVDKIVGMGHRVFLDLKFHDIPNTVAKSAIAATRMGVSMFNVHCVGGSIMMNEAVLASRVEADKSNIDRPIILGVTVLTSMAENQLSEELGVIKSMQDQVNSLAYMAKCCGLDGVVCSPQELERLSTICGQDWNYVTPGVRPSWSDNNDQQRIMTPKEAISSGATMVVIGRPITDAPDPVAAASLILQELEV